jgi:uncharacterized membrane protein YphA (DoxX/SURF4 family)
VSIRTKTLALLLAMCMVVATAGTAFAQDNGYEDDGDNLAGSVQGQGGSPGEEDASGLQGATAAPAPTGTEGTSDSGSGSLPFTGLDVALILGVGGVLVAAGLATRQLTRRVDAA